MLFHWTLQVFPESYSTTYFLLSDETVFEMKAQAQINLHEWIPAISSAQQCINIKPNWYIGHQTLGNIPVYKVRLSQTDVKPVV